MARVTSVESSFRDPSLIKLIEAGSLCADVSQKGINPEPVRSFHAVDLERQNQGIDRARALDDGSFHMT
jgi:hypothetical protein